MAEVVNQLVFFLRQLVYGAVDGNLVTDRIERRARCDIENPFQLRTLVPQFRNQTGFQFLHRNALADVIVCADAQSLDRIFRIGQNGQEQNRHSGVFLPDFLVDLVSVQSGHSYVEQNDVGMQPSVFGQRIETVVSIDHFIPVLLQTGDNRFRQPLVVFRIQ